MTNIEKNIAIAEMMGAESYLVYQNKNTGYMEKGIKGDIVEVWRNKGFSTGGYKDKMMASNLKFDTSANWQYEAIEFIENLDHSEYHYRWKQGDEDMNNFSGYEFEISRKTATIWVELQLDPFYILISTKEETKKEAVFEALYQFSQHLKTLK